MSAIRWPQPVTAGARVGIVTLGAPDVAKNPENFARGLAWLRSHDLEPVVAPSADGDAGFLAAAPAEIVRDLNRFLRDPDIALVIAAGGGANCNRLLSFIDPDLYSRAEKGLMGLSNPTVLLNALTARSGVVSFHGPAVVWNLGGDEPLDEYSERHLWRVLRRESDSIQVDPEEGWEWLRPGDAVGRLFGGNLWSLQQLLGTPYEPDWTNSILFLEDCFTQLHQVDAMLTHFDSVGVFERVAGLVVGVFESCEEEDYPPGPTISEVVMDIVGKYDFPVLNGVHLGHTQRKITIPIGAEGRLRSSAAEFSFH